MDWFLLEGESRVGKQCKMKADQHHFKYWFDKGHYCVICASRIFVDMGGIILTVEGGEGTNIQCMGLTHLESVEWNKWTIQQRLTPSPVSSDYQIPQGAAQQ